MKSATKTANGNSVKTGPAPASPAPAPAVAPAPSPVRVATPPAPKAEEFKIEDGIPVPMRGNGADLPNFPFDKLGSGQSFLVPADKKRGLRAALTRFVKKNPSSKGTFVTRKNKDNSVRVWKK